MSFLCGVLFAVTTAFSLNVLYHDLFVSESGAVALLGSLYRAAGNGAAPKDPRSPDFISPPEFRIHHPFTALLPAKQACEIQFEVPQEETTENDVEPLADTRLTVIETGLAVIQTDQSVIEIGQSFVQIVEIESDLDEESQEIAIVSDDLPGEMLQTCPAKDAASSKTKVEEAIQNPISQVISLGEDKNTSATNESDTPTEKEIHKDHPAEDPVQQHLQNHLERDVFILMATHLTLVISVLVLGCRCLYAHKYNMQGTVDVEELLVTVGLISCIVVSLFALLGATIILFIRILLAKFP
ncbi:uncharacterized protein LOC121291676 [Carcharodon carcharias]|uniref:uncharacterized protein LOC121291676 n=1 Tax=Carcharodon carcharias TaxID=13397 RepID=UPI001B7DCBEC|nr:uncharacterized protein LOC121291676 [Carcharodon carcharias]